MNENPCLYCLLYTMCAEVCEDKIIHLYIIGNINYDRKKELLENRCERQYMGKVIKKFRDQFYLIHQQKKDEDEGEDWLLPTSPYFR
jgi:hypothetical protein